MGKLFKIAFGLFLIGVGLVAVFAALTDTNILSAVNEDDFVLNELIYDADEFDKFDFDFDNRDFIISGSDNDEIKIVYYTTEKDPVVVTENDGTLELVNDVIWYDQLFVGWNFLTDDDYFNLYLYLPDSMVYELELKASNGDIDIFNIENFSDVFISTTNGIVEIDNVISDSLDLNSSNGRISVSNTTNLQEIDINTSNGRIYLTDVETSSVDAYTSNGKIIVKGLISTDISLDTSNGSIEVEIVGDIDDYEIFMDTSNGSLSYDGILVESEHLNENGQYEVRLDTSNGDITLTFID